MKLAEKLLSMFEKLNLKAIADQLANNEEVMPEDLVDVGGIKIAQAEKLIKSWFDLGAMERNSLGFSQAKLTKWVKDNL